MKASELRIGNLINGIYYDFVNEDEYDEIEKETICTVATLDSTDMCDYRIYVESEVDIETFSDFQPIPLTEEWLLKFGFGCEAKIGGDGIEFRVYHFDVLTFNTNHGWWYKVQRMNDTQLEYVHQLQNFYFALTGEELIFNQQGK